jgi:hypothetical protein
MKKGRRRGKVKPFPKISKDDLNDDISEGCGVVASGGSKQINVAVQNHENGDALVGAVEPFTR